MLYILFQGRTRNKLGGTKTRFKICLNFFSTENIHIVVLDACKVYAYI